MFQRDNFPRANYNKMIWYLFTFKILHNIPSLMNRGFKSTKKNYYPSYSGIRVTRAGIRFVFLVPWGEAHTKSVAKRPLSRVGII